MPFASSLSQPPPRDVIIRGVHFSQFWRLGEWAAWSLNWHFAGMWFLTINGLIYLVYGFATGRLREKLLPIRPAEIVQTIVDTLHFKIAHEDITVYNAVQKLLYMVVIFSGISQVVTGLAVWKSTAEARTQPLVVHPEIMTVSIRRAENQLANMVPTNAEGYCLSSTNSPATGARSETISTLRLPILSRLLVGNLTLNRPKLLPSSA